MNDRVSMTEKLNTSNGFVIGRAMFQALALATFILHGFVLADTPPAPDPCLSRMIGQWTGLGERVLSGSGNRKHIRANVTSRWAGDRVVSLNEVQDGDRKYLKVYWVKSLGDGSYGFGSGNGEGTSAPEIFGKLQGETLTVDQALSSDGSLSVHSETTFTESGSDFLEIFRQNDRILSETRIHYRRNEAPQD